jgi:hypothetical protein
MKIAKPEWVNGKSASAPLAEVRAGVDLDVVTTRGTFRIRENRDGSLEIRGTENNLAVFPKTGNALHVYLLDPFTLFGTTDPHAVVEVPPVLTEPQRWDLDLVERTPHAMRGESWVRAAKRLDQAGIPYSPGSRYNQP